MFVTKCLVVPSRKPTLDDSAELGIDRLHIFIRSMSGTGLPIDDLSVLLEKLYLDLSGVTVDQLAEIAPAIDDGASYLLYTVRTKRICFPRESQFRLRALIALQKRCWSPGRLKRLPLRDAVCLRFERSSSRRQPLL